MKKLLSSAALLVTLLTIAGCCCFRDYSSEFEGTWNIYYEKDGTLSKLPVQNPPQLVFADNGQLQFNYSRQGKAESRPGLWKIDEAKKELIVSSPDGKTSAVFAIISTSEVKAMVPKTEHIPNGATVVLRKN